MDRFASEKVFRWITVRLPPATTSRTPLFQELITGDCLTVVYKFYKASQTKIIILLKPFHTLCWFHYFRENQIKFRQIYKFYILWSVPFNNRAHVPSEKWEMLSYKYTHRKCALLLLMAGICISTTKTHDC